MHSQLAIDTSVTTLLAVNSLHTTSTKMTSVSQTDWVRGICWAKKTLSFRHPLLYKYLNVLKKKNVRDIPHKKTEFIDSCKAYLTSHGQSDGHLDQVLVDQLWHVVVKVLTTRVSVPPNTGHRLNRHNEVEVEIEPEDMTIEQISYFSELEDCVPSDATDVRVKQELVGDYIVIDESEPEDNDNEIDCSAEAVHQWYYHTFWVLYDNSEQMAKVSVKSKCGRGVQLALIITGIDRKYGQTILWNDIIIEVLDEMSRKFIKQMDIRKVIPDSAVVRIYAKTEPQFRCFVEFFVGNDKKFEFEAKSDKCLAAHQKLDYITSECCSRLNKSGVNVHNGIVQLIRYNARIYVQSIDAFKTVGFRDIPNGSSLRIPLQKFPFLSALSSSSGRQSVGQISRQPVVGFQPNITSYLPIRGQKAFVSKLVSNDNKRKVSFNRTDGQRVKKMRYFEH